MSATWDEIKRLAADFQRVQLSESSMKLSERNCIELINKLIELDMLKVFHSIDGKEYITDKQLERDICDELYVHEGRINQCELQTLLNIDITHIEKKVTEIVKNDSSLVLLLGQIISKDYMNKIAEEINEILQEKSRITISELTNLYELPTAFMIEILTPRIGSIIKGNFDGEIFYTLNFIMKQKALLTGALEACIKPIRIEKLVKEYNLEARIVFETYDALIASEQIKGTLFGGKQAMSAVFVPAIYNKAQEQYVKAFFNQNGYVEYTSLKKIGITEPNDYVRKLFAYKSIDYLSSSCFADYYLHQMREEIEDMLNREGYSDLSQVLPSILKEKDINELTSYYNKNIQSTVDNLIMSDTYLVSKSFVKNLATKFQEKMDTKACEDLKDPQVVLAFRTERAVMAGYSPISASFENEKKKGKGKGKKSQSPVVDNFVEISFIDQANLEKELNSMIKDLDESLVEHLVENFYNPFNRQYFDLLKTKVESGIISSSSECNDKLAKPKNTLRETQEKIKLLLINARIFEKGVKSFSGSDSKTQDTLNKHLIKTVYSEMVNEMVKSIANEHMISYKDENFTADTRSRIIFKMKDLDTKSRLGELNTVLSKGTNEEIAELIEKIAFDFFELSMKKQDARREKEVLLQLKMNTKESLEKESDPATILQLTCMLLYHHSTNTMVSFPGRLVPAIIDALKTNITEDHYKTLIKYQNLIIENLTKSKESSDGDNSDAQDEISNLSTEIKNIGMNAEKSIKSNNKDKL